MRTRLQKTKETVSHLFGLLMTCVMLGVSGGSFAAGASASPSASGTNASGPSASHPSVMGVDEVNNDNAVSVRTDTGEETGYATWEEAVVAIDDNTAAASFDILLLKNVAATTLPGKPCTISGNTSGITFDYVYANGAWRDLTMKAPLTFRNISLKIVVIEACGHALTFDEGVECLYKDPFDNNKQGIQMIYGGEYDKGKSVESTNIVIKSGQFETIYGGGFEGEVTGTAKVAVSGGTVGTLYGGGQENACTNTDVTVSDQASVGTLYGGGAEGKVTGTAKVAVSGGKIINLRGGGRDGDCENTEVTISGDATISGELSGGGAGGKVTGTAKVTVNGGEINTLCGGGDEDLAITGTAEVTVNGGKVTRLYGGGGASLATTTTTKVAVSGGEVTQLYGGGEDGDCENTEVTISGDATIVGKLYGGGLYGNVTGTAKVTVSGGEVTKLYGGGLSGDCANTEVSVSGGKIETLCGGGYEGKVTGTAEVTVSGGTVSKRIESGNSVVGEYKPYTLTLRDVGTESEPYPLPVVSAFTEIVLVNSIVKPTEATSTIDRRNHGIALHPDHPVSIKADKDSKLLGENIPIHHMGPTEALPANVPLITVANIPYTTTFRGYPNVDGEYVEIPVYRAGATYRLQKTLDNGEYEPLYDVNITFPEAAEGTLSVKWGDTELMAENKVPKDTVLTVTADPIKEDYVLRITDNGGEVTPDEGTIKVSGNTDIKLGFLSLDLGQQTSDVTISKEGDTWKYTAAPLTKTTPEARSFDGTVKGWLPKNYRVVIASSARGTLHFISASITTSTDVPESALTIEEGADVTFTGTLRASSASPSAYCIANHGKMTIRGDVTIGNVGKGGLYISENATIVVETRMLSATGIKNEGTLLVRKGASFITSLEEKAYEITITSPDNGELTVKAGDIDILPGDKAMANTPLTVEATPADGYRLSSILVTEAGGTATTLTPSGIYKMPAAKVTFSATFELASPPAPDPVYYEVTLPAVEGAVTNPSAGVYTVDEGGSFSFALELEPGYDRSEPIVTAAGQTLEPRPSDGRYEVTDIYADVTIAITGVAPNPSDPTGIGGVYTPDVRAYVSNDRLYLHVSRPSEVRVYHFGGTLLRTFQAPAGDSSLPAPSTPCIVVIGERRFKLAR